MKVLITGACGAVGSHVAEAAHKAGHDVTGLDAFTPYYDPRLKRRTQKELESLGIGIVEADLAVDELHEYVECDAIIHLAAQPGISATTSFDDYVRNNVIATEKLLDAASRAGKTPLFVNVSTSSVYGLMATGDEDTAPAPASVYGVTKLAAEQLVMSRSRDSGFPAVSMRLFSVYGERERPEKFVRKLIESILTDKEIPLYEGSSEHVRSYTYVGDAVQGILAPLDNPTAALGEIFNIGTDVTTTTGRVISLVEDLLGKKARILNVPPRSGDQKETAARITKARDLLKYSPVTSIEEGLARQVAWMKKNCGPDR